MLNLHRIKKLEIFLFLLVRKPLLKKTTNDYYWGSEILYGC